MNQNAEQHERQEAAARSMGRSSKGRTRISITRRGTVAVVIMVALVAAASSIGLWFAVSVERNIAEMQKGIEQAVRVSVLQQKWLTIVGLLDTLSVARANVDTKDQLEARLSELDQELVYMSAQPLGLSPEMIAENQKVAQELQQIGVEMDALVRQIYEYISQNRWGTALQRRQSQMADLQARLDESLTRLNENLKVDVERQTAQVRRLQMISRLYWFLTVTFALGFAGFVGWTTRRTIIRPIGQLTGQVEHIIQGDLSPISPLEQGDEIGDLSRAIAVMTEWLRESYTRLEERVAERTQSLERRTLQLQVAAQVARDVAATHDLEVLFNHAVNLIRDRFGFYHAGIFLVDQPREFAVLYAATGKAGQEMLARGHRLKIGEVGLVGYATQTGKSRLALDVGQDAVHFKNPLLPETRSEVALPLKVGDQVIGALDVQSQEPDAFDEESLAILQVMADQLAIAIQNALLLQEAREHLNELEAAYGRFDRKAWQRYAQTSSIGGYEYDGMTTRPIYSGGDDGGFQRIGAGGERVVSIPLKVRDQVIGAIDIWPREGVLSDEETYLLTNLSNRISQVMESARLYEEAQERAAREQQINWIASQVRSSVNIETILQNTVRELGRALGASHTFIQIGAERGPAERSSAEPQLADLANDDGNPTDGGSSQGCASP